MQLDADALAAREAQLASSQQQLQEELEGLLARQEARLREWEDACAEQEVELQRRRQAQDGEERR